MSAQGRKRTVVNGRVHEGFGETERSEAPSRILADFAAQEDYDYGPERAERDAQTEVWKEEARVARLNSLRDEYRPSMDAEVLHSWAQDIVAALQPTVRPKVDPDPVTVARIAARLSPS